MRDGSLGNREHAIYLKLVCLEPTKATSIRCVRRKNQLNIRKWIFFCTPSQIIEIATRNVDRMLNNTMDIVRWQ